MILAQRIRIALSTSVFALIAAMFCRPAAAQNIIHVPADSPSIAQAIAQAQNGDTILVSPGTYLETIDFQGKAVTVASTDGPAVTIIDAHNVSTGVFFMDGEGPQSVLRGFTITNGVSVTSGAGIYIANSSPTIDGNIITANHGCQGIGIEAQFSSAIIKNNFITNNNDQAMGCSFILGGAGIRVDGSGNPQILNNVITGNETGGNGGGIELSSTSLVTISGNTIQNNTANSGGGIDVETGSSANIVNNLVTGNIGNSGSGIYLSGVFGNQNLFVNNTIAFNAATFPPFGGQQIWLDGSQQGTQFFNNVIVDGTGNGAVMCNGVPNFTSNDLLSTQPTTPPQPAPPLTGNCFDVTGMNGNLQVDPQFVNPAGDYHLQASSPLIDAGTNSAPSLPDKDLDGNPRIGPGNVSTCAGTVDMGAYELTLTSSGTAFLSTSSMDFGTIDVGSSSVAQNTFPFVQGCVGVASIKTTGDFSQTNNCGHSLSNSSFCEIQVTFTPTASGLRSGTLTMDFGPSAPAVTATLTGQGFVLVASASPTSLGFPDQVVGTPSAPQFVTVFGAGTAVQISSLSVTGDYAAQSSGCSGPPIAPFNCVVSVTFAPTATGSRPGTLVINTNQGSFTIALNGNGINPQPQLSPSTLAFGNQLVNTTSASQAVTLTNAGVGTLQIFGFTASGDFAITNNCGSTIAQGGACTITVTFRPTVTGARSGSFTVSTNNGNPGVALSGTGVVPVASASPSALSFANQLVNSTSSAQAVTVSNTGGAPLHITSITASGDFAQGNGCGASLDPGTSCSVNVTFTPSATGSRTGSLAIVSDGGSPSVSLSGTGVAPVAAVTPSTLTFSGQLLNTTSSAQTVTLSNTGTAALQITSISVAGNFFQTNNCGASLDPGASCSINVSFAPAFLGQRPGTLTVSSNGGTANVALTGTGIASIPSLSPSSLTFGNQLVGTSSAAQSVTLTNTGNITLNISSISATLGFGETNSCGASLAAGASCTISVIFTPYAAQAISGAVNLSTDGFNPTPSVSLSGQGIAPVASLSPASLNFGNQTLNTTSSARTITLSNTGTAAMQLASISITSTSGSGTNGYAQTNNCGPSLNAGASCAINVTFTPNALGGRGANLTVSSNAPSAVASLGGTGVAAIAGVTPSSLTFGNQQVQTSSAAQAVTLTNSGNVALSIASISTTGDFSPTNNCGASVAAGASCAINVMFTPTARLVRSGSLIIQSNSTPAAPSIPLSGTGIAPAATLTPSLSFGLLNVGASATQSATLSNVGDLPLTIASITASGSGYSQSNSCGSTVAAGGSCTIQVTFRPSAAGLSSGSLTVIDNDPANGAQTTSLTGTGVDFTISASPTSVSVNQGQTAVYTISLAPLGGNFPNSVSLACSGLPTGTACNFGTNPAVPGPTGVSSSLSITTAGSGNRRTPKGSHSITVSGTNGNLNHSVKITLVVN